MATAVRKTNWFAIWISVVAVVVVVVVTGLVVVINNQASGPGESPSGGIVNTDAGAVTFGKGSNKIDTYVDFLCPYCNQFEQASGPTIKGLVDKGDVTLRVHPVTILDRDSAGTSYSSRAAGAFFAVASADPSNAYAFMQAMYANQPEEGTAGLTDDQIVEVAKKAGVKMTADLEKAITTNKYQKFAQSHSLPEGATGTPTVVINGKNIAAAPPYDPKTIILPYLT